MRARAALIASLLALVAGEAAAWPEDLMKALSRDARRLVPRSLGQLLLDREDQVLEQARLFPPELAQALAGDLSRGQLSPATLAALEAHAAAPVDLIRQRRVGEGVVRLGALLRVPADLSDPVLSMGAAGYAPGVAREYYAFVGGNLSKIPVVLDDAEALKLERRGLPAYWQRLLDRSRVQAPVIGTELYRNGRVVSHTLIDFRSPVFGVASLSYSRAVTAIAASWLALWREVKGDLTRQPQPFVIGPRDGAPDPLGPARPPHPLEARKP